MASARCVQLLRVRIDAAASTVTLEDATDLEGQRAVIPVDDVLRDPRHSDTASAFVWQRRPCSWFSSIGALVGVEANTRDHAEADARNMRAGRPTLSLAAGGEAVRTSRPYHSGLEFGLAVALDQELQRAEVTMG
jgi:hypothetical protein